MTLSGGYHGKLLTINLTDHQVETRKVSAADIRNY